MSVAARGARTALGGEALQRRVRRAAVGAVLVALALDGEHALRNGRVPLAVVEAAKRLRAGSRCAVSENTMSCSQQSHAYLLRQTSVAPPDSVAQEEPPPTPPPTPPPCWPPPPMPPPPMPPPMPPPPPMMPPPKPLPPPPKPLPTPVCCCAPPPPCAAAASSMEANSARPASTERRVMEAVGGRAIASALGQRLLGLSLGLSWRIHSCTLAVQRHVVLYALRRALRRARALGLGSCAAGEARPGKPAKLHRVRAGPEPLLLQPPPVQGRGAPYVHARCAALRQADAPGAQLDR